MDMDSTGKPTRTVTAQAIANLYNAGGVAGVASFTTSLNGLTPNVATTGAVTLAGTLGVASGGTGVGTLTSNGVLFGGGTSPIEATAVGASGEVLTSNGAGVAPTFQAASGSGITTLNAQTGATQTFTNMANGVTITSAGNAHALGLAGQIPTGNGGTGLSSYQIGDLIYATGANTLAQLTIGSTAQVLKVVGGVPAWGNIINQGEIAQYNIPVGDASGEAVSSSRVLIGRSAANSVEIGNNASANLVYINNTDASSATVMYGQTRFPVTFDGTTNNNLGFGNNALNNGISGNENTSIGVGSMVSLSSGSDNTALGKDAGKVITSGSYILLLGSGSADNITTGAGKDNIFYDTISDSSGNTKDTITDFKQSTLNATTGAQITNGDSISLIVTSGAASNEDGAVIGTSFVLADKGDVANAGEAVNAMNNSKGSFVFAKDNDVLYIDMDGDSTLNTDDYAFTLTGLDSFHGADIDVTVTGDETDATTITTLDGNDIITTGSGNDTITSGAGADIISAGAGDNTITSGAGADSITVAGSGADGAGNIIDAGSGNDTVVMGTGAGDDTVTLGTGDDTLDARLTTTSTEKVLVTDFEDAGVTVGDTVILAQSLTTKNAGIFKTTPQKAKDSWNMKP